jgi:hypothetical protein
MTRKLRALLNGFSDEGAPPVGAADDADREGLIVQSDDVTD